MMPRCFCRIQVLVLLICLLSGCGYRLSNATSGQLSGGQALWVPFIGNETVSPTAQTVLRRALYDECHALRGLLASADQASADLYVKGRLLSYSKKIISYTSQDQAREYRLSLDLELELYKKGGSLPVWKGTLQASKNFPANADLALQRSAEEQAVDSAARIIAQKFIQSTEQSF
jgi:outer membrane lipopolysaccharide assembly protein LptE/RlpB